MKNFIKANPPRFWFIVGILLIVVLTIVGISVGLLYKKTSDAFDPDVLAVVAGEKITKKDLNLALYAKGFSGTPENPGSFSEAVKKDTLNNLIEIKIAKIEAKTLGVSVTDDEVNKEIQKVMAKDFNAQDEFHKNLIIENSRSDMLLEKVKNTITPSKSGKFLFFYFHKYMKTTDIGSQVSGMGDQNLIDKQKTAALGLAKKLSQELRENKITYEQAKNALYSDPNVGYDALLPRSPALFGSFTKEEFTKQYNIFYKSTLYDAALKVNKGEVSEPIVDYAGADLDNNEYRYVVFIIEDGSPINYKNYEEWLAAMKNKHNVKINSGPLSMLLPRKVWQPEFKLTPTAQAAVAGCSPCNVDNADIAPVVEYYERDSVVAVPLVTHTVTITGCSACRTIVPNGDCNAGEQWHNFISDSFGNANLCGGGYSFYCNASNYANIALNTPNIPGTSGGYWTWDGVNYSFDGVVPGTAVDTVKIKFAGANTTRIWELFRWHPTWLGYNLTVNVEPSVGGTPTGGGFKTPNTIAHPGFTVASTVWELDATKGTNGNGWSGDSKCGTVDGVLMDTNKTCTVHLKRRDISCTVSPQTGLAPLVVKVTVQNGIPNGTYNYDMNWNGTTFNSVYSNRVTPVYYTYETAGRKRIIIQDISNGLKETSCSPDPLNVSDPSSGTGGEVAP